MLRIGYLYPEVCNYHGEKGNIISMIKKCQELNIEYIVKDINIDSDVDFYDYDILLLLSCSMDDLTLVLEKLNNHVDELKKFIEDGKILIATGNAYPLFGEYMESEGDTFPCLNIFPFYTKITSRRTGDIVVSLENDDENYVGFVNRNYDIKNNRYPLFNIVKTNSGDDNSIEGLKYNNTYITSILGPLLSRNPDLIEIILEKYTKECYECVNNTFAEMARIKVLEEL